MAFALLEKRMRLAKPCLHLECTARTLVPEVFCFELNELLCDSEALLAKGMRFAKAEPSKNEF